MVKELTQKEKNTPWSLRLLLGSSAGCQGGSAVDLSKEKSTRYGAPSGHTVEETVSLSSSVDMVVAPKAEVETINEADPSKTDAVCLMAGLPATEFFARHSLKPGDINLAGRDVTDALSAFSFYMESDFRYYFQHPYIRLFIAYFVTFCNFFIYAEDPIVESKMECNTPIIGNDFTFIFTRYAPNAWSCLKVVLWLVGIIAGMVAGKMLIHTLLFNKIFRLKMFSNEKGSWMTIFFCTIMSLYIFSYVYNAFLWIGGNATIDYHISSYMNISNQDFTKAAATGTWCGDFFTAWMVTDIMLQEKLYPFWALRPRCWWNKGYRRIILFWITVFTSSFTVVFIITTDYISWDHLNQDLVYTDELSRAFLASGILVMDVFIIMQDWDFPHFVGAIEIKLPGVNVGHIHIKIPNVLKKLEYWHIHITGKWFNYGILFIVILLDLNMWKNQIFYDPFTYGQYVDSKNRIYSVLDEYSLKIANQTTLSFAYRNATIDPITGKRYIELDKVMNARYQGYALWLKAIAFIPSGSIFITFGAFVWLYGRLPKPTKRDPYGGRLKIRKKWRFSAGIRWKKLKMRFRTTPNVVSKTISEEGEGGEHVKWKKAAKVVAVWQSIRGEVSGVAQGKSGQNSHQEGDPNLGSTL
ncbi:transmembrane protein 117-like isoform X2 [Babylonia areolata]